MRIREITGLGQGTHFIVWLEKGTPVWVVALEGWVGRVCGIHFACDKPRMLPRKLCKGVFGYAFGHLKLKAVYGYQDSLNEGAIRLSGWIGFKLVHSLPEGGLRGDLRIVELRAGDCRWWKEEQNGEESARDA
jgi:RimJ/RimL family protein N-acetyltransferase